MRSGERIVISDDLSVEILGRGDFGERTVQLSPKGDVFDVLERAGHVPLPPYIHRPDTVADRERYQTVFARERGSVAAPTAGLHFTPEILDACSAAGAAIARVTLHVGLGTFQPLHTEIIEEVKLHSESFSVPAETVAAMDAASRIVAVGTTSVRAIESDPAQPAHRTIHLPGFSFPQNRSHAHQLPSAEIEPAGAGLRLCRNRVGVSRLPPRRRSPLPFLLLRRLHADRGIIVSLELRRSLSDLLAKARTRSFQHLLVHQLTRAAAVIFGGGVVILLAGTEYLSAFWLILLVAVAVGAAIYIALRKRPSTYRVAQRIDAKLQLHDTLSTAAHFLEAPGTEDAAIRESQRMQAERAAQSVDLKQALPLSRPRALYPAIALALALAAVAATALCRARLLRSAHLSGSERLR